MFSDGFCGKYFYQFFLKCSQELFVLELLEVCVKSQIFGFILEFLDQNFQDENWNFYCRVSIFFFSDFDIYLSLGVSDESKIMFK